MFRSCMAVPVSVPLLSMWILAATTRLMAADAFITRIKLAAMPRLKESFVPAQLQMAQVSQAEAQRAINTVVTTLRKDSAANKELGKLEKVTVVLGYGSPANDVVAVRFNASFRKSGFGLSAVPLPFGLGQTNESEGRGAMVGQVKASVDIKTKSVKTCSVFRDLGYGRSFELKC